MELFSSSTLVLAIVMLGSLRLVGVALESMSTADVEKADEESKEADKAATPEENESKYGELNSRMGCPHCNKRGTTRTQQVTRIKGISGGKTTAALITAGLSLFAVGLAQKVRNTQAHCDYCKNTWYF